MSYLDNLTAEVDRLFEQVGEGEDLQEKVLEFLQRKSKESFKNGIETARQRRLKTNDKSTKRSYR